MPEMSDFSPEELAVLMPLFISSARGYLEFFQDELAAVRAGRGGHDLEPLHRSIHSLKGAALQLGLHPIGLLAKAMELVVKDARQRERVLPEDSYPLLEAAARHLSDLVGHVEREEDLEEAPANMLADLDALNSVADDDERPARAAGE